MNQTRQEHRPPCSPATLAILAAGASVLQTVESLVPHPVPGIRLGLANLFTLIVLVRHGGRAALSLAAMRTLLSSLVLGTFLTPGFLLSFAGAVMSSLAMLAAHRLSLGSNAPHWLPSAVVDNLRFSYLGISVVGSIAHTTVQLTLVYLLFLRSQAVLWLWPWMIISAVIAGLLTGWIALATLRRLDQTPSTPTETDSKLLPSAELCAAFQTTPPAPAAGPLLGRLAPAVKIWLCIGLCAATVAVTSTWFYLSVFVGLSVLASLSRISWPRLFCSFVRALPFLSVFWLLPVVFTPWGRVLFRLGPLLVTDSGMREGTIFVARIGLLLFVTAILLLTTTPEQLVQGLEWFINQWRRLKLLRRPQEPAPTPTSRFAQSLVLALNCFPAFWNLARNRIAATRRTTGRRALPAEIAAQLILLAESFS